MAVEEPGLEWPYPCADLLRPALRRLAALGSRWAWARGRSWPEVLNDGPVGEPPHLFRWRIVEDALRFAAGQAAAPPRDYAALPVQLQTFLAWAVPVALATPAVAGAPDLERSRLAAAEATRFAAELELARSVPRPAGPPLPAPAPAGDTDALLASALAVPETALPAAALELRARLRTGPLSWEEVRALAADHGCLPSTLLDALDAAAVRTTGRRATRSEGGWVYLHADHPGADAGGNGWRG